MRNNSKERGQDLDLLGSLEVEPCQGSLTTRCIPTGAPTVLHKFVAKVACGYREAEQFEPRGVQPACQRGYAGISAEACGNGLNGVTERRQQPPDYPENLRVTGGGAGGFPSKSAPLAVPRAARAFHERGSPRCAADELGHDGLARRTALGASFGRATMSNHWVALQNCHDPRRPGTPGRADERRPFGPARRTSHR